MVWGVGLIVGLLLFPHGAVTLLSGTTVSFANALGRALHNDLQHAALELAPSLAEPLAVAEDAGALGVLVSGSGPTVAALAPEFGARAEALLDWRQTSLLSVVSGCLPRWSRAGLLLIGDAAHPASPVGGVGINLAVQDALEVARLLTAPLKSGVLGAADLIAVERARRGPTRLVQACQGWAQRWVVGYALRPRPLSAGPLRLPSWLRLAMSIPALRRIPGWLIAFAARPAAQRPVSSQPTKPSSLEPAPRAPVSSEVTDQEVPVSAALTREPVVPAAEATGVQR